MIVGLEEVTSGDIRIGGRSAPSVPGQPLDRHRNLPDVPDPPTILFIPFSQFVGALRIDNTIWSLILTYPTFTVPFCTWLLMGFFRSVPKEIEERALLDGGLVSRCFGRS